MKCIVKRLHVLFFYIIAISLTVMPSVYGSDFYILPESGSRYLNSGDIKDFSLQELCYARNEIYARHGRKFRSVELTEYFNQQSWYQGIIEPDNFDDNLMLNEYEKKNVNMLRDIEVGINNGQTFQLDQPGYDINRVIKKWSIPTSNDELKAARDSMLEGNKEKLGTHFNMDLDGDGQDETVDLYLSEHDQQYLRKGYFTVNSYSVDVEMQEFQDHALYGISIDGKTILLLTFEYGPSDDEYANFWRYSENGIENIGRIETPVNKLKAYYGLVPEYKRFYLVGTLNYIIYWSIGEDGKLVKVPRDYYEIAYDYNGDIETGQLLQTVTLFEDKDYKSNSFTVDPQLISFLYTDGKYWIYIQTNSGEGGWFPAYDYYDTIDEIFGGLKWAS